MAKKAFVIGANSKKLDYAESDAKKISRALRNLGYEVDGLTTDTEESYQVVQRFRKFAATCKQYDTLIFYFAGHGVSHNNTLYLALNSSKFDDITSSAIPITDITTTLNSATAQNRLIILDCCEASSENLVIGNAENYQVLRATEKWQRASEFEELKAGFLSFHLHKLLTEPVARHLLNENHGLTFNTLLQELRKQVLQHNQKHPDKIVPKFVREGKDNNDYEIATLTPQYAGLLAITPQFIEQERDKHSSNPHLYSCEQFYGANPQAQWWGIINGLVAERAIYADIKAHIHKALSKPINKPIITLVLGSGGMGKSTFLRQLAVDLAQNYKVFWLQDWESFEAGNIADNLAQNSAYQLICLDNWHRLADEDKKSIKKWLEQHSDLHSKIKWLLSDREEAKELSDFIYGKSCFDFDDIQNEDKEQDNKLLLTKIAEKMISWKKTALALQSHSIAKAKPYQILFVVYRWAGREEKIDFEDFETSFHKIIEDDVNRLQQDKQIAGFANALIDFSYMFINYNLRLTQNTFLRLANHYNNEVGKNDFFLNYQYSVPSDDSWGLLNYYLTVYDITNERFGSETVLGFTKEDLAEVINQKFGREFERRKKSVCYFIAKDESKSSSSNLLHRAIFHGIFNAQEAINFSRELIEKGNDSTTYIDILIAKDSPLQFENSNELNEIIEQFIAVNPNSTNIFNSYIERLDKINIPQKARDFLNKENIHPAVLEICFNILGKNEFTQQKAIEILAKDNQHPAIIEICFNILGKNEFTQQKAIEILTRDNQHPAIVKKCLNILGKHEYAQQKATELLAEKNQDAQIICKCFDILGENEYAQQKATELLAEKNQDAQIICKCLDILGKNEYAQQKAIELLAEKNQDAHIICKCLNILGKTEYTQQKASELLVAEIKDHQIICKCFDILGKTEETQKKACELLLAKTKDQIAICKCFDILGESPKTQQYALALLQNWESLLLPLLKKCIFMVSNTKDFKQATRIVKYINREFHAGKRKDFFQLYCLTLQLPLNHVLSGKSESEKILNNWKIHPRILVGASLVGNHHDLPKVKQVCQEILSNWEREISYQQEKGYKVYHFHIFKALSYPSAEDPLYRRLVDMTANAMLEKEKQQSGFLGDILYEAAYNIVHHQQYPAWIPEEDI